MYHYVICHWVFACIAYEPGLINAMVQVLQESVIMYTQESYRDVPPKNGIYTLSIKQQTTILAILRGTYLYEACLYQRAGSCTIALFKAGTA